MGLFSSNVTSVGIDLGSSSIKVVELKKESGGAKLLTYGFTDSSKLALKTEDDIHKIAQALVKVCAEAGVMGKSAVAALPTFSVFSSVINFSNVKKKDIPLAVNWEAKKVIPLPLEEMILDWKIIAEDPKKGEMKVLLTGATKSLVKKYIEIFKEAQIGLISLETETFSLIRSMIGNDKSNIMLVDIGNDTSDITIVSNAVPLLNRSINIGGKAVSEAISNIMSLNLERAEQFKFDLAMQVSEDDSLPAVLADAISPIVNEIKYTLNLYQSKSNNKVEKILLTGGSSMLYNMDKYLTKILDVRTIVGDAWARTIYPPDIKPILEEISPRMSVAVGLALRGM